MNPVRLINPKRFEDSRGWFSETYNEATYQKAGIEPRFIQDNHSLSRLAGTVRGLHFQTPPKGQDKLVRCSRGSIYDVAVDVRQGSPTYGKWVGAELSAQNGLQIFVPVGFAHGFLTLEPDTEVIYKVSELYSPAHDAGIRWDDAHTAINWPLPTGVMPTLSDKDERLTSFLEFISPFEYDGNPLEPLA